MLKKCCFAAIAILGFCPTTQVIAKPYASRIQVSSTIYSSPFTIRYNLNESADSILIEIMNGATVAASFAGTTVQGANAVVWNGTVNNAGGAAVATGSYTVRIRADKNTPGTAWTEVASQRSLANAGPGGTTYNQVFNGFSPNAYEYVTSTTSNFFGLGFGFSCFQTPKNVAAIPFNSDCSTSDGTDGYASRIFKIPALEAQATIASPDAWGADGDPDNPNGFYQTGQDGSVGSALYYGDLNSSDSMVTADPLQIIPGTTLPRDVAITKEGANKYAYFTFGNSTIAKVSINTGTNTLAPTTSETITAMTGTTRYSRGLDTDLQGNLYWVSKQVGTAGAAGILLRWNASQIQGMPLAAKLTEANAVWSVTYPASMTNMMGPAIDPDGNVYVAFTGGVDNGIYLVGNASTPTLTKVLSASDRVVSFQTIGSPAAVWSPSSTYFSIQSDPVGNIIAFDRVGEQLRLFGAPGASSKTINAPTSQGFVIGSGVSNWSLY